MSTADKIELGREVMSVLRAFAGVPGLNASGSSELQILPDGRLLQMDKRRGEWVCIAVMIMGKTYVLNRHGAAQVVGNMVSAVAIYSYLARNMGVNYYNSDQAELTEENIEQLKFNIALKGI